MYVTQTQLTRFLVGNIEIRAISPNQPKTGTLAKAAHGLTGDPCLSRLRLLKHGFNQTGLR
jgi:hypothetical protein